MSMVIITTVLLCLPGAAFPKEHWFDKIWLDKWIHVALFGTMVFLWCRVLAKIIGGRTSYFLQLTLYFVVYGIVMEFVQKYFIPNRSFDIGDVAADAVGSLAGYLLSIKVYIKNRPL